MKSAFQQNLFKLTPEERLRKTEVLCELIRQRAAVQADKQLSMTEFNDTLKRIQKDIFAIAAEIDEKALV